MSVSGHPQGGDQLRQIEAVRRFTRFYTRRIGVLEEGLLGSDLSLPETRLVYELAQHQAPTVGLLAAELGLDTGYLSRLASGLERRGLVVKRSSPSDGRQILLTLSDRGREIFSRLDAQSSREVGAMLAHLTEPERRQLAAALATATHLLGARQEARPSWELRSHRPGDMGWIVHRHGVLYADAYGWDESFEALVAGIVSAFIRDFDARRERCWIAELNGESVGSVFLTRGDDETARLRLLYVEPHARGRGIGEQLVEECLTFGRQAGYRRVTLWTNDILVAARRIYERAGFTLVKAEPHRSFGHDLIGETWERPL